MKAALNIAIAASLAAGATAQPHAHHHRHQHARKSEQPAHVVQLQQRGGSPVLNERDVVVVYETPMETAYVLGGESITSEEAQDCLNNNLCEIVGETEPTFVTPTPTPTPSSSSSAATSTSAAAGEFFEAKQMRVSTSSSSSVAPTSTSAAAPKATQSSTSSGASGIDADFPDGELDCSELPTAYGAVAVTQVSHSGWGGLLDVGTSAFTVGSTKAIASYSAPSGGLSAGMFGTYQCPEGYDMAQWPEGAQGATGQSIGGLWCGLDNKLYLTRSESSKKLCQKGAGNVKIVNKLGDKVSLCKTAYPGKEDMVLSNVVEGGATYNLYNPYQNQSYSWQGASTSAQYYVNLKGLDKDIACQWTSPDPYSLNAGNWAGVNLGTSVNDDGTTFLSIFHNTPTSNTPLDFNIKLSGDVSQECTYSYSSNSFSPSNGNGCTVAAQAGGTIFVTLSS
ncbi:Sperm-associated antigen 4 protein [Diaporthe australafricana]|uniref:Sperm-associated antigen 4 protein n=1 Tax=Diaporthe australafricana TaxID=127596 RepID=A0ABR3WHH3_9PEZI